MHITVSSTSFGAVVVRAQRISARRALRLDEADELRLVVIHRGLSKLRDADGDRALRRGEGVLVLPGASCDVVAETPGDVVVIAGPGGLARDVNGESIDGAVRVLFREALILAPMVAFALETMQASAAARTRLGDYYVERLLQEMLQGLLATSDRSAPLSRAAQDPYRQALTVMSAQFADAGLTIVAIAEAVSLSPRQLERHFHRRHTTIRRELRRIRIERATLMLQDSDYSMLSVEQVAQHVGFSGASSLARALANDGHGSPTTLRRVTTAA